MAFDAYLKIDKIDGESTAKDFEKNIEIYSFSIGASNPTTIGPGTEGSGGGRVSISSFNFLKKTDATSPQLFLACCTGTHFDKASVTLRKAGGTQNNYLVYEFEEVYVDSVQWSGSSGGDDTPSESVSFSFGKVSMRYTPQAKTGQLAPKPIEGAWDLRTVSNK